MAIQTDPYTAVNGSVIDALEINARFNPLYALQNAQIDYTNMDPTEPLKINSGIKIVMTKDLSDLSYVTVSSSHTWDFYANGVAAFSYSTPNANFSIVNDSSLTIGGTGRLRLDGDFAGDTYIHQSSANVISVVAGTSGGIISLDIGGVTSLRARATSIAIDSTNRIYYDGNAASGDTYTLESSANVLDTYVGGTLARRTNSAGEVLLPAVSTPTANYANRNGIVKAWGYVTASGGLSFGYNVTSVSAPASSVYTITWATDFGSSNYVVIAVTGDAAFGGGEIQIGTPAAGTCTVKTFTSAGVAGDRNFYFMAIGDQ